jgi:hypothetical protein
MVTAVVSPHCYDKHLLIKCARGTHKKGQTRLADLPFCILKAFINFW